MTRAPVPLLLGLLLLPACDAGAAGEQPLDTPPIHITAILAATSATGDSPARLAYTPLAPDGLTSVVGTTAFRIRFDRLLAPVSAARQSVCLQPLLKDVRSPGDCTIPLYLEPTYDPVRREATFRQSPMAAPLTSGILYEISAYTALDEAAPGFRSFDGAPLPTVVRYELGVLAVSDPPPPADPLPTADHYCTPPDPACLGAACARSVAAVLAACGTCHGAEPAAGLDLATAAGLASTAFGQPAHGSETGENAGDPDTVGLRFGRAMPIIDPGAPGNSYLLYKLVANPHNPLTVPFAGPPGATPPEVLRAQRTIIAGLPMPPDASGVTLRAREAEWISDWILQGAPAVDACP